MRKIGLGALAIAIASIAAPVSAQITSGTINVSGTVAPKCQVVFPGPASQTFTSNVDLGDISQSNGLLRTDLATLFNAGGLSTANLEFQIVCTTAAPFVTLDADPIVSAAVAGTGYANRVDYRAIATFDVIGNTDQFFSDSTDGAASTGSLSARLVTGQNNLTITADTFRTPTATDVVVAGAYSGVINIIIAPTT